MPRGKHKRIPKPPSPKQARLDDRVNAMHLAMRLLELGDEYTASVIAAGYGFKWGVLGKLLE